MTDPDKAVQIVRVERNLVSRLAAMNDLSEIAECCLDAVLECSGLECGSIYLQDDATSQMSVSCRRGLSESFVAAVACYSGQGAGEQIPPGCRCRVVSRRDMASLGLQAAADEGMLLLLAVPIIYQGSPVAFLYIASRTVTVVPEETRAAVESIAEQMGAAIARAQAERLLRESEDRYRSLFEQMIEGFAVHEIICNEAGEPVSYRFLDVNPAFEQLTGWSRKEIVGKTIQDLLPHESETWVKAYGPVALYGESIRMETYSHGLRRHYAIFAYRNAPGQFAVVFSDITARKHAEDDLQHALLKLRTMETVINRSSVLMFLWQVCEGIWPLELVSENVMSVLGYSVDEFRTGSVNFLDIVHPEDVDRIKHDADELLRDNVGEWSFEYRLFTKSRELRWVKDFTTVVYDRNGTVTHVQAMVVDVTQQKQAEQEKLEMERRFLHAQKLESLGVLAGGIAHDFNNILAGISGYTELLKLRLAATDPACGDVQVIQDAVGRAAGLTQQMLAYAGKGEWQPALIDLSQVLRDTRKFLEVSISKKAVLTYEVLEDVPDIQADPSQIQQVILNLVINASESLGEESGVITISCRAMELDGSGSTIISETGESLSGSYVCLTVSDTGCGITQENLSKIYDPFFTTKFTGRGLGMAAVQGIVRSLKGAIKICSEMGRGTRFEVYMPACSNQ